MPEVLGNPPSPRTALFWNGTAWQWARVDAAGHLQIDVLTIAAGVDVATAANQATMITALQLIDDLVVALGGPGNVRLIVRGEDQLYSVKEPLAIHVAGNIVGADGYLQTPVVPGGEIWKVTSIAGYDNDQATTAHYFLANHDGTGVWLGAEYRAFAAGDLGTWIGEMWLDPGDFLRVHFIGGLAGDAALMDVGGHRMTLET